MTTIAVAPDRWTFDGTDLSSYATMVRSIAGAEDLPDLRGDNVAVPNLPGRRWASKLPDARRFALALHVTPMNASGGLTEATQARQAQANIDALRTLFSKPGRRSLVHVLPDGSNRTAQAEAVGFAVNPEAGRHAWSCVVDFLLADPHFYGANVVDTARSIAASPTAFAFVNPGSDRTNGIVLDFTGPIANPRVTNGTNGIYVECLVTVGAGLHLVIDCAKFTALNDGVQAIGSIRHSGDFRWLILEPGSNALSVTATSPGGTLTTTATAPYHG